MPVLSTPVGIAPLVLDGLSGALCGPFDEEQWLSRLSAHVGEPDPRLAGRSRAALFSSELMAARVVAAYRSLLQSQ